MRNSGITFTSRFVNTRVDFLKQLEDFSPDLVLSDYAMPQFNGMEALELVKERYPSIPLIIVTGSMNEETAVECLKNGAADYVIKEHLTRLGPAVEGALKNKRIREDKERAEDRIEHLNSVLHSIRSVNQLIFREKDRERLLKGACDNFIKTRGYYNAWLILLDENGELITTAESNLGKDFQPMIDRMKLGELPDCAKRALAAPDVVEVRDALSDCIGCPLEGMYVKNGVMTCRLEHEGRVYGVLTVSVSRSFIHDEEEQYLFKEVSDDISFALHSMELEENQKKAEEALQKSEQELNAIFKGANDGIALLDKTGKILRINNYIVEIGGYTEEELVGKRFSALKMFPLKSMSKMILVFGKLIKGQEINYEVEVYTKKGEKKIVEVHNSFLKKEGKVEGVVAILRDITERKQAEEDLKKKLNELEIFNDAAVGRELKMIELKKEINALLEESGNEPKYEIAE